MALMCTSPQDDLAVIKAWSGKAVKPRPALIALADACAHLVAANAS